jgi:hypothetical protein
MRVSSTSIDMSGISARKKNCGHGFPRSVSHLIPFGELLDVDTENIRLIRDNPTVKLRFAD